MIRILCVFCLLGMSCRAVEVVLGVSSNLVWSGTTTKVASFSTASGDWWDGLGLSKVWRIDAGTGTNIVSNYGGSYPGGMSGTPWTWVNQGGLMSLRFGGTTDALGSGKLAFPPSSPSTTFNIGNDTSFAMGGWVWLNWIRTTGSTLLFGTSSAVSVGAYQVTLIGSPPYGRVLLTPRTLGFSTITNQVPLEIGTWNYIAIALYPRTGNAHLFTNDGMISTPQGAGTNLTFNPSLYGQIGNGLLGGAIRDFWLKHDGTTADCEAVWNATRSIYGK